MKRRWIIFWQLCNRMNNRNQTQFATTPSSSSGSGGVLQRQCSSCGNHTMAGGECQECGKKNSGLQRKLTIGASNDPLELEADRIADQVMAAPANPAVSRAPLRIQRFAGQATEQSDTAPASVDRVLAGSGSPLETGLRQDMESRFGHDFSQVRVHSGATAEQSAQEVNASAYTVENNIVFGAGRFAPRTYEGRRLLAHELTHVVQQSGDGNRASQSNGNDGLFLISSFQHKGCGTIRRCVNPAKNDPLYDWNVKAIKATAAYKALSDKTLADSIITDAKKKPACLYYVGKLQDLFGTSEKAPATISTETKASTVQETAKEQTRVAKPAEAKNLTVEEKASADPARTWVKIKGKFGGGTYQVDRTDPKNIVVKAKLFLKAAGTGAVADIDNIKKMEDGIEKAAAMKGFTVDIEFVKVPDAETFTANVDPSRWEDAENWSGGEPRGFAHELMHMFAYELDRYDYIESHAKNQSMTVPNRLIWFAKQLTKPGGFDNPLSIMGSGEHPLDDDACRVAGLDVATCVAARQKPAKP